MSFCLSVYLGRKILRIKSNNKTTVPLFLASWQLDPIDARIDFPRRLRRHFAEGNQ